MRTTGSDDDSQDNIQSNEPLENNSNDLLESEVN